MRYRPTQAAERLIPRPAEQVEPTLNLSDLLEPLKFSRSLTESCWNSPTRTVQSASLAMAAES